ncbi:probable hexosyltransferase MUCI70 isoform X1 [Macadamia integrifolia]|uniref:probable hexosyltransferase MUCI70 isoform X1 n=1 Tax=Macadamia integrifolia TaxID=60698 RepID=UPI001C4EF133|nr:probable hexosyltransferase MUCI70 isoform X1 [Macadamia integrifolia]
MFNSVSISISDDESDELAGKMRVRSRRKRKKLRFRGQDDFLRRMFRKLLKWWMLLLFLPAVGLLILETSRIAGKPNEGSKSLSKSGFVGEEISEGNLNHLNPTTRMVNGVREQVEHELKKLDRDSWTMKMATSNLRTSSFKYGENDVVMMMDNYCPFHFLPCCLKLLPPEKLQHLDIPAGEEPTLPVKRLVYKSDIESSYVGGNATVLQHTEATRFNLFTGYQTLHEREQSFKVNETAVVHCGFYSENGGFKVSIEDKNYMQTCKVVVSTCTFGGGDDLYQPINMTEESLRKVCYVAFWDDITFRTQEAAGRKIDENQMIGKWRIVLVKDLPFTDQRLNGKIPKMLSHRLFPQARYSVWVDSKSQFRRDPLGVLEALLWRTNSTLAISEHGARSSVYDEARAVVKKHKATPEEVEVQLSQYRRDGFPNDKRYNGKKALSEASVILREHTPLTNLLMCLWFNEVVRFTSRDQLSFPYVLRQLKVLKTVNMFPVCTRKDLVNSMGHLRKAQPLVT